MWSAGEASGHASSGSDSRLEPLLPADERTSASASRCQQASRVALVGLLFVVYAAAGALDRLCFTRMTEKLQEDVLLMHTLLATLSMTLFVVLWMARAQSSRGPIPEQLQRLNPIELLQMAALDTMHTLLALDGASGIAGTMQAVLLQVCPVPCSLGRAELACSIMALCTPKKWSPHGCRQPCARQCVPPRHAHGNVLN